MVQAKTIDGQTVHLPDGEVKRIADHYWETVGKRTMQNFYSDYKHRAAENIRKALGACKPPENERDIKGAIALALRHCDAELAGDVLFEAMEWQTAYAALKNIEVDND